MFCIRCGRELPENAVFCPACGNKVTGNVFSVQNQPMKTIIHTGVCSACGSNQLKELRPGVVLCEHCGTKSYTDGRNAPEDSAITDAMVTVLLKEAEEYSANNDLKNELLSLSKALPLAPENYTVLYRLGRCYNRLDFPDKALEYFRKADALYPNDPDVTVMLGTVHMDKGKTAEAKPYYEKALSMIEENLIPAGSSEAAIAYLSYGLCLGRLGDKDSARKYFSLAKKTGYSQLGIENYCNELGLNPDMI